MLQTGATADRVTIGGLDGLDPNDTLPHYSVVMALSGGGIRGLASIGVLKAFEERRIDVVGIAGTSMGGIVGGLYAAGYRSGQLEEIANHLDFQTLFQNAPPRTTMLQTRRRERGRDLLSIRFDGLIPMIPQGLTSGQQLTTLLTALTTRATYQAAGDFDKLPIPFATVSTDVVSGKKRVLRHGSLADAMRATMAFPLAFTGLEIDGELLMDGGMVDPIPVDVARQLSDSVDYVVAVNTASPLVARDELITPVDIANQVTTIMTDDKLRASLEQADYVIDPIGCEIRSTDFRLADSLIDLGYRAGLKAADSITSVLRARRDSACFSIAQLNLHGATILFRERFEAALIGDRCTRSQLIGDLKRLARTCGLFELQGTLMPEPDSAGIEPVFTLQLDGFTYPQASEMTVRFVGNLNVDDAELHRALGLDSGYITPGVLRDGLDRIRDVYLKKWYDLVTIRDVAIDPYQQMMTIVIDEAIINRIMVQSGGRTKDWYIRSHFPLHPGQPFSTRRALQGVANIYGTDLFDRVMLDLVPDDGEPVVVVRVEEKKYRQLRLGWHWDDEYDSEEFAELLDDNVGGAGLEFLLHARYSPDRQFYATSFKADRIFKTYLTAKVQVFHSLLDRHLYDDHDSLVAERRERKTGFEGRLGQQIARLGTVSGAISMSEVEYRFSATNTGERFGLRALSLESLVETFDRVPFTNSGKKHYFELQQAGKLVGGDVEYTRFFTSIEAYFPFGRYLNYHPKIAIGISRSGLPWSEKFYLGGMHSFAGYRTYQLAGDKMILVSNELRARLPLHLYLSLRYDLGDVYAGTDEIKLESLRHGGGAFLALDTPLGPFEIGYGAASGGFDRFYLRAGFQF